MRAQLQTGRYQSEAFCYICQGCLVWSQPFAFYLVCSQDSRIALPSFAQPRRPSSTVIFSDHLSRLQIQIQISHRRHWLSGSASNRCTTAPQSNPSCCTYFRFFYFVLGQQIFFLANVHISVQVRLSKVLQVPLQGLDD